MAWEVKEYELKYPIEELNGEAIKPIKTVTLKMPNGRKLRAIEALTKSGEINEDEEVGIDVTLKLISILSDLPEGADDELHTSDIIEIGEAMGPFLEGTVEKLGMTAPSSSGSPTGGKKTATS